MIKSASPKKLVRSNRKIILGVCAGIADYFNLDPTIVRLGWVVVTVFTGFILGVIAYMVAALIMPEK